MNQEKRTTPGFKISLAVQIVAIDNQPVSWNGQIPVNWDGQTKDIGAGGVRFVSPRALPVGNTVDYVVTLSDNDPPARVYCVGRVLRCEKKENAWETAATMNRYVFIRPGALDLSHRSDAASGTAPDISPRNFGTRPASVKLDPATLPC